MIITKALANTSITSRNYHFFFVVGTIKISSLSQFKVYDTVSLSVITAVCIRSPGLISLLVYPQTSAQFPQPLVTAILLSVFEFAFSDSTWK